MRSLVWSLQSLGLIFCIAETTERSPKPTPEPLWIMAHLSVRHPTLNQRLSEKDNLPQISYFSGYHTVKKKGCLFNPYLSGFTLHPQPWPSLINPLQKATDQARTGKGCSPPRRSPTSVYHQHSRNISSPGSWNISSWCSSSILVESTQATQLQVETGACCSLTT